MHVLEISYFNGLFNKSIKESYDAYLTYCLNGIPVFKNKASNIIFIYCIFTNRHINICLQVIQIDRKLDH